MLGQLIRYALVGGINTALGAASIFGGMVLFHLSDVVSNMIGFAIGFVLSYFLNRLWTFASTAPVRSSLWRFAAVTAVAYACNLAVMLVIHRDFGWDVNVAQLAGIATYTVIGFVGNRYFTFSNQRESKELA